MNMLRALELLKEDLKSRDNHARRFSIDSDILDCYSDGRGVPYGRLIHFYGHPDSGKTSIAKDIIGCNYGSSILYISSKLDDLMKMDKFNNTIVLKSNVFEDTIDFLSKLEKDELDIVILDDINNMLSKEELLSAFTKKLDNRDILNKYIKKISQLAAQKNFIVIIFNGINLISNKSRYGYIIEKESIASFRIEKRGLNGKGIELSITPDRNVLSNFKETRNFNILFNPSVSRRLF